MRKFILHTTTLLFVASLAILIILFATNSMIRKNAQFRLASNVNMVVLGHSHPECAFNDSLITNLVNYSNSGESYFYTYIKLDQLILQNSQLKTVFLEFSNNNIAEDMDQWIWGEKYMAYRYKLYAPFMDAGASALLFKHNPRLFVNSLGILAQTSINNIKAGKYDYIKKAGGYFPLVKEYKADAITPSKAPVVNYTAGLIRSSTSMEYLDKIIQTCTKAGIRLYLLRSPLHRNSAALGQELLFRQVLDSIRGNTEFLDFKWFPLPDASFGDAEHLNYKGARTFSAFFNALLQQELLSKNNKQEFIDSQMQKQFPAASY